jgi:hypothetical protein
VTVAAVILATSAELGPIPPGATPRLRRQVDAAWAGGATPIVVVAEDGDGRLAAELASTPAVLAEPSPGVSGTGAALARGVEVAQAEIRDTDAALAWPARMAWTDPETVTSLIEAHGLHPDALILPAYRGTPGWPILVPASAITDGNDLVSRLTPESLLEILRARGAPELILELGDPGTILDHSVELADLPPYEGPPAPVSGADREWGAMAADEPDDAPLAGPSLPPYPQASDADE